MKIAVTADLHLSGKTLQNNIACLKWAVEDMGRREVEVCLIAGDIFDKVNIGDRFESTGRIVDEFRQVVKVQGDDINFIAIPGQHDEPKIGVGEALLTASDFLDVFGKVSHFYPTRSIKFHFLPWLHIGDPQRETWQEQIKKSIDPNCFNLLIGHAMIAGAVVNEGHVLTDSDFCLYVNQIEDTGIDLAVLGDIHKGQEYSDKVMHVGALNHRDFREANYDRRYLLLDIEGGKLKHREWIYLPDEVGTRYLKMTVEEAKGKTFPPNYEVIIEGEVEPEELPENVKFRSKKKAEVQVREEIKAVGLWDQYCEWAKINGLEVNQEENKILANAIANQQIEDSISGGSIERIDSISLKNIAFHENSSIVFPGGEGTKIIGICGENGAGKSTMLEAVFMCFFGDAPSYKVDSIYDMISEGHIGEASIEVKFKANGIKYTASREMNRTEKTKSQKCWLYQEDKKEAIAGSKEKDFVNELIKIVGTKEQILGSVFMSQTKTGDLSLMDRQQKLEFLNTLFGFEKYGVIGKELGKNLETVENQIDKFNYEIEADGRILDDYEKIIERESEQQQNANGIKIEIQQFEDQIKSVESEISQIRDNAAIYEEKEKTYQQLQNQFNSVLSKENNKMRQVEELKSAIEKVKPYRVELKKFPMLKAKYEEMEVKYQQYQQKKDIINKANLDSQNMVSEFKGRRAKLEFEIQTTQSEIRKLEAEIKKMEGTGCAGSPLPCKFIDGAIEAKGKIESVKKHLTKLEAELKKRAYVSSEEMANYQKTQAIARQQISFDTQGMKSVADQITLIGKYEKEIAVADNSQKQIISLEEEIGNNAMERAEISRKSSEIHRFLQENSGIKEQIADKNLQITELKTKLRTFNTALNAVLADLKYIADTKSKQIDIMDRINHTERQITVIHEISKSIKQLRKAFHREGIPQYLLSSSMPYIQDKMNQIFEKMNYPYIQSIELLTQIPLKGGGFKEDFEIFVNNIKGKLPIKRLSGGQRAILQLVLRLAVVLFKASHLGGKYKLFIADEPMAGIDDEKAEMAIQLLRENGIGLNQMIISSHDDQSLMEFDHRFLVAVGNNGSEIREI